MRLTPTQNKGIFGNEDFQKYARAILPVLIFCAQQSRTVFLKDVGDAIDFRAYNRLGNMFDYINTELFRLSESDDWDYDTIPTLSAVAVRKGNAPDDYEPTDWMYEQMQKQKGLEPTRENYDTYLLQPVFEYEHWGKVMKAIIQSPKWNVISSE